MEFTLVANTKISSFPLASTREEAVPWLPIFMTLELRLVSRMITILSSNNIVTRPKTNPMASSAKPKVRILVFAWVNASRGVATRKIRAGFP